MPFRLVISFLPRSNLGLATQQPTTLLHLPNMHVFLTGGSGFIGSATVAELTKAGHQLVGLARSDAAAAQLTAAGVQPIRGSLTDLDILRSAAAAADGVIHLGFSHDFSDYVGSCEKDRKAIQAMGEGLASSGHNKPFIITNGTLLLPTGRLATENDDVAADEPMNLRAKAEDVALSFVDKGVRVSIIRLPPTVHGEGDHGFVPALIDIARKSNGSGFIGDGNNRWPAVHRLDVAVLYRLALENAPAGSKLHGIDEEGIPTREIANIIGKRLGVKVESQPADHFGFFGMFYGRDNYVSSKITKDLLGWVTTQPKLLVDLDNAYYFKE
jgi:nucleoside-diphosphate-sugar epimerase